MTPVTGHPNGVRRILNNPTAARSQLWADTLTAAMAPLL